MRTRLTRVAPQVERRLLRVYLFVIMATLKNRIVLADASRESFSAERSTEELSLTMQLRD